MDLQQRFCPNMDCPARGHTQRGNIKIHCHKRKRLRCTCCGKTFSHRTGTPFFNVKTETNIIVLIVTLIAYGCPIAAIEAAFSIQRRTIREWTRKTGTHAKAVHEAIVLQPQVLHHVQVDELFARTQQGATRQRSRHRWCYLFSSICVSTRLWLGGLVSIKRDEAAARRMAKMIKMASLQGPLLLVTDGFRGYQKAFLKTFATALKTGKAGRPRHVVWRELVVVQQVKQAQMVRLIHGSWQGFAQVWRKVGSEVVSTSYIERLNATFRERLAPLARRSRHLARQRERLESLVYLMGTIYNFCTVHGSLGRTPAMAAGLTSECWSVERLLWHRVAADRWKPPRHRGPLSKRERALLAQWGT